MCYYDSHVPTCHVNVLGTDYSIYLDVPESEDMILSDSDGYCDKTSHKIVICAPAENADLDDFGEYRRKVMRHEIIHAFLFESGMGSSTVWYVGGQEHPEQTVDWLAVQFPKMLDAFRSVGAL